MPGTRQAPQSRKRKPHVELVALRVNEGLSHEALGYRAGVSRETVRMVEQFGCVPTPRIQHAIAKALGKQPLDLWPMENQRSGR